MLDRLKIGTHITLFPEWLIEWEYRAMDFDVGAEWIFSVNSESGEIEALEAVEGSIERTLRVLESEIISFFRRLLMFICHLQKPLSVKALNNIKREPV